MTQQWRTRRMLAFLPGLEIGKVRTTTCRVWDVFAGSQIAWGHRRFEFREEVEGHRGILLTEEKFKKAGRVSKELAESALSRSCVEFAAPGRGCLNSKYRLQ